MQSRALSTRIALLSGGVLAATSFLPVLGLATAHADEQTDRRSKQYKTGAVVLGAAAAYFALKSKKTVPAVVAGAGAYYAYKKSQDLKNQSNRYGYDNNGNNGDVYPDQTPDYNTPDYRVPNDGGYANYPDDNGYENSPFPVGNDDYGYGNGGYDSGYAGLPNGDYPNYNGLKARGKNVKINKAAKRITTK